MHELTIRGKYPALQTSVETFDFIHNVIELYEEIVMDNCTTKYQNQIPTITDFMIYADFTGEIDNLASHELFGVDASEAPVDEESNNMFWMEYERQAKLIAVDVASIMVFYNMSYCIDKGKNSYINLPIKEVW